MKSLKQCIKEITARGISQREIVERLKKHGYTTTAATISRIASGKYKSTNFELGIRIVAIHREVCGNG